MLPALLERARKRAHFSYVARCVASVSRCRAAAWGERTVKIFGLFDGSRRTEGTYILAPHRRLSQSRMKINSLSASETSRVPISYILAPTDSLGREGPLGSLECFCALA